MGMGARMVFSYIFSSAFDKFLSMEILLGCSLPSRMGGKPAMGWILPELRYLSGRIVG